VVLPVSAQDPTKTLPESYKVELDNEQVRVVRVHYAAGAKLPEHTHPGGTTVYVYLNDSEGVVFKHSGRSNRAVTRPAVKAGSVRVASGPEEDHTAENPASTPSDFLRIWLKGETAGGRTMRRITRGDYKAGENVVDEQFENTQLRITRLIVVAGKPVRIDTPKGAPAVLIALSTGEVRWIDGGEQLSLAGGEFLRIDLL
jgi:hypothetical protein